MTTGAITRRCCKGLDMNYKRMKFLATSHKPQAISHKAQATSHKPQAISHKAQAISHWFSEVANGQWSVADMKNLN